MILPGDFPLDGVRGAKWDAQFQLFADDAETVPFPLTGYTVTLIIDTVAELTEGNGLTVTADQGLVVAQMRPAPKGPANTTPYRLKLDSVGGPDYPIKGEVTWQTP